MATTAQPSTHKSSSLGQGRLGGSVPTKSGLLPRSRYSKLGIAPSWSHESGSMGPDKALSLSFSVVACTGRERRQAKAANHDVTLGEQHGPRY